jgi:hypothetical protein
MARSITVIRLWSPITDCALCSEECELSHSVGWYEGPLEEMPGDSLALPNGEVVEVGGMPVCRTCHDRFYRLGRFAEPASRPQNHPGAMVGPAGLEPATRPL